MNNTLLCVQSLVGDQGSAIDQDIGPPISGDSNNNYKTIKAVSLKCLHF